MDTVILFSTNLGGVSEYAAGLNICVNTEVSMR